MHPKMSHLNMIAEGHKIPERNKTIQNILFMHNISIHDKKHPKYLDHPKISFCVYYIYLVQVLTLKYNEDK